MLRNVDGKSANPLPRQLCCRGKGENIYDCQMRTNGPQRYVSHISFLPEAFESGAPVINLKGIIITTIAQSNALRRHLPSICDTCSVDSPCVIGRSIPIIEAEVGKLPADHMAIGLGRMFGFHFLENFNYPYIAKSITEFWRRWHISLSTWFRDYLYIPLGGNRCSRKRQILNLLVVWGLTGLWHGAEWNFICWGLYYALLLIGERYVWGGLMDKLPSIIGHIYTMLFVMVGWLIFRASS